VECTRTAEVIYHPAQLNTVDTQTMNIKK